MTALTSIAPAHYNNGIQNDAVKSWLGNGLEVISFNHPREAEMLKPVYENIKIIPTIRTMEKTFYKPYVNLNVLFDYAKESEEENFLFINSDIILKDARKVLEEYFNGRCKTGIGIIKRMDYTKDFSDGVLYDYGMDAFMINKQFLDIFPQSIYCMGQTWWDYWIPFRAIREKVPIFLVKEKIAYHKTHPLQYDTSAWAFLTEYFQWENRLPKRTPAVTTGIVYSDIHANLQ